LCDKLTDLVFLGDFAMIVVKFAADETEGISFSCEFAFLTALKFFRGR
jgi:hypothetical protein